MAALHLERVWKRYGDVAAVQALSLSCEQGQMLAVLGPSGCGKSSTLKMIAGIETVSEGCIRFDDTDVSTLNSASRNVAMVFEDYSLYPHLSVFDNVAFPLQLRGVERSALRTKVDGALELLGLQALRDTNVRSLSGGAQQRVSIGRALVRDPALVLFDEPLSHLDADQKAQLRTEIKRLQQSAGLTSVLVTHDQTEAMSMADRIAVMNFGVLQQVDSPERLYGAPANLFVAGFIGEPAMNLVPVTLGVSGERVLVTLPSDMHQPMHELSIEGALAARLREHFAGREAILGIRPEQVEVRPPGPGAALLGRISAREPRGDTDVLTVALTDWSIAAELPGPSAWREGDVVELVLPAESLHFFDATSGINMLHDPQ
ncbi:MAG: ABC transporter ATP-binding protein [Betaproteobacteria bacterium]